MAFQFTQTGQELQYLADEAEKIAAEYDAAASWTTGDYCTHEGTIYRCTASTTGTFDATKWTAVILCDELEGLRTRMTTAEGDISAINTSLTHVADNGWFVIKYPDGRFDAIRAVTLTVNAGSAWSGISGLYYHRTATLVMPSCAATVDTIVASVYGAQLYFIAGTDTFTTAGAVFFVANASSATGNVYICCRLTGTYS